LFGIIHAAGEVLTHFHSKRRQALETAETAKIMLYTFFTNLPRS
jgi:hypothetical protein